jgi:hypothetical protein
MRQGAGGTQVVPAGWHGRWGGWGADRVRPRSEAWVGAVRGKWRVGEAPDSGKWKTG